MVYPCIDDSTTLRSPLRQLSPSPSCRAKPPEPGTRTTLLESMGFFRSYSSSCLRALPARPLANVRHQHSSSTPKHRRNALASSPSLDNRGFNKCLRRQWTNYYSHVAPGKQRAELPPGMHEANGSSILSCSLFIKKKTAFIISHLLHLPKLVCGQLEPAAEGQDADEGVVRELVGGDVGLGGRRLHLFEERQCSLAVPSLTACQDDTIGTPRDRLQKQNVASKQATH